MITKTTTIGWGLGYRIALSLFGVFLLFCGWGMWYANAAKTEGFGWWAFLILMELFFFGIGLMAIGWRMAFTVVPRDRRVNRLVRFFGIPVRRQSWPWSAFEAVSIRVTQGAKGSRSAAVQMSLRATGEDVTVTTFMMGGSIPEAAQKLARELSQTLGIRYTP